jgi:tRNA ligase
MATGKQSEEDSQLIRDLYDMSRSRPKLVKSSTYPAHADSSIEVTSWKMNEFKYYDVPSPFPTLARGLFTMKVKDGAHDDQGGYRIAVRGYDKFFNIGEVPWNTWEALGSYTTPPYTLTLKSNGCIIFIASLSPEKLLVTSKHSLGPIANSSLSHAQAGEAWLRKYLVAKGKTEADLATRLWNDNLTAVAELCDDSFEEHVLPYSPENTGLHLHGLNVNAKLFTTLPQFEVDLFAEQWGFIKTESISLGSIEEVKEFTARVGEQGEWNGEAVEGFVVRTTIADPTSSPPGMPYSSGTSFFFKVKFDEPYMMYRDWRELTKTLLSAGVDAGVGRLNKAKMRRQETKTYVKWVIEEIKKDPTAFEGYNRGHGIIATRERFLHWMHHEEKAPASDNNSSTQSGGKMHGKLIIAPVAIPGSGKTAVAVALSYLFGFGHTQSDNVTQRKAAPLFMKNIDTLLHKHDVVIADRNNHLQQHRRQLREVASNHDAHVLALQWSTSVAPLATIHRICADRVLHRGANHQSLLPDANNKSFHEDIIWQFIRSSEELEDGEVDEVVDMTFLEDQDLSIKRAVNAIVEKLGLDLPSKEKMQAAVEKSKGYLAPTSTRKSQTERGKPSKKKNEEKPPRFFGFLPELSLTELLQTAFDKCPHDQPTMWKTLLGSNRVTLQPHITLVHQKSLLNRSPTFYNDQELWNRCTQLTRMDNPPSFVIKLGKVLWDTRVMIILVEDVTLSTSAKDETQIGAEFILSLGSDIRGRLHITVGTRDNSIPPVEGKELAERWGKKERIEAIERLELGNIHVEGRVAGLFH